MNAVKYKTALTTTGVIRESLSKIKLWEFSTRHWYQEICCLYKMLLESPCYFHKSVPLPSRSYRTRQCRKILLFNVKNNFFRKTFSPSPIIEWNKSNTDITNDCQYANDRPKVFCEEDIPRHFTKFSAKHLI